MECLGVSQSQGGVSWSGAAWRFAFASRPSHEHQPHRSKDIYRGVPRTVPPEGNPSSGGGGYKNLTLRLRSGGGVQVKFGGYSSRYFPVRVPDTIVLEGHLSHQLRFNHLQFAKQTHWVSV
eukprot:scaffold5460_cov153-Skeletonema_dohrnii-CCMP3373.AAC.4